MGFDGSTIVAACGQIPATHLNEADVALAAIRDCVGQAAEAGADLLVLPECAYPAYLLGSVTSYRQAGCLRGAEYLAELGRLARTHRLHLVTGYIHEEGELLYNGAALIDARGRVVGRYEKTLLWHADKKWFERGRSVCAFDCEFGRIGMLICADLRIPELMATLVADGAQLVALPTCWINFATQAGTYYNPQSDFLVRARSREFGVPMVCANKFGIETGTTGYNGQSMITDGLGHVLVQAEGVGAGVVSAKVALPERRSLVVAESLRERLLEDRPAVTAPADTPATLTAALWSEAALEQRLGARDIDRELKSLRSRGVSYLFTPFGDRTRHELLCARCRAAGIPLCTEIGASDGEAERASIVCIAAEETWTFAAIRAACLRGALLVAVWGEFDDLPLLRCRALENRVFVAHLARQSVRLVGPNGELLSGSENYAAGEAIVEIPLAEAAEKCVAPDTDIFADRVVSIYRF